MKIDASGYLNKAQQISSPNFDTRPPECDINLLVIHNISLPPNEFGGDGIIELFTNQINPDVHPSYQTLIGLKVSAHFLIRRDGEIIQFVSCLDRAWHAGESNWQGKTQCNDFSIGIELEGSDQQPFTEPQYAALTQLTQALQDIYSIADNNITGHANISPGRKTDPGPNFDWHGYRTSLLHWQQIFVGREQELNWLQQTWAEVKKGQPRLCVLRGESGFGKTKIIQKFYSWLSRPENEDPSEYWPDTLLREQNNLRVNPRPEDFGKSTEIPWLWWGIGWSDPHHRNQNEADRCGFLANHHHLKPHEVSLLAHKKNQGRVLKALAEIAPVAMDIILTGVLASISKLFLELGKTKFEEFQAQRQQTSTIAEREQQILQARLETLHQLLKYVLTKTGNAPALPLILVLDDAQWMDQASAQFVENLFHHAVQNDWPLLILATHWEQEWNLAQHDPQAPAVHLPVLYKNMQQHHQNCLSIRDIYGLHGLETIIKAAFPGLTASQINFVSQRSEGNPLQLNEILQELQEKEFYFQDQDLTKALIPEAMDEMAKMSFKLHEIQKRRFEQMSKQLKTLLAYASYHGMRFIKDLLLASVARMDSTLAHPESTETLSSAIRPYAILAMSSAVIYEFRHRGYYEFACQRIKLLPKIKQSLAEQIITVGKQWIQQDKAKELPIDEQENFYLLLLAQQAPLQADPEFHLQLLVELLQWYQYQGYFSRAIQHLDTFEKQLPEDAQIDFATVPFWTQIDLVNLLNELNRITSAEKLAKALQQQCFVHLKQHGDSEQRLRDLSISQERVADVLLKRDNVDDALELFQASLVTREQILRDYGDSEQRLHDLFISYFKLSCCFSEDKLQQCKLLCEALLYSEKRLLTYPQYATQIIAEHEMLLLQVAEPLIQALDDATLNQQFKLFQQNFQNFKQQMGIK